MTPQRAWRHPLLGELFRFGLVGAANTATGLSVILILMLAAGWTPFAANLGGYAVALSVSYVLNRRFTFQGRAASRHGFARFIGAFALAYSLNLATLLIMIEIIDAPPVLAQGAAVIVYAAVFFLLCRLFVFQKNADAADAV